MPAGPPDYFLPETGAVLTHLLIVRDVDRTRQFYRTVLDADVVRERDPCVLRFPNGCIVLNTQGGPTTTSRTSKPSCTMRCTAARGADHPPCTCGWAIDSFS